MVWNIDLVAKSWEVNKVGQCGDDGDVPYSTASRVVLKFVHEVESCQSLHP